MTRISALIIVVAMLTGSAAAQTDTTFTYQGELIESGEPANGSYNVDFALWDAPGGGSQVGSTIEFNGLPVTVGLFTVELDFGASVFDGSQLWLEIAVDGTDLVPRQPITGTPYAIQTRGIFVDPNNNVGIGTTSPAWEFEVANVAPGDGVESAVTAEDAAGAIAAYSSTLPPPFEHYAGRVSLFSDIFTQGLDLRANSATGDIRFHTGGLTAAEERMRITNTGKVGIGTDSPASPLEVHNSGNSGQVLRLTSDQSNGYMQFVEGSTTRAYLGYGDDGGLLLNALPDSFAIDGLDTALHFAVDSDAERGITIDTLGHVAIGTASAPSDLAQLYVVNTSADSYAKAVNGDATNSDATGNVGGRFHSTGTEGRGVYAWVSGPDSIGVMGVGTVNGVGVGVKGVADAPGGRGVFGHSHSGEAGVYGYGYLTWDFFAGGPGAHYGEASSIRWKSNIRNIETPLEKMARLRGVYFDWDEEHGGHHDMGMIAEEVGAVLPEIVTYEENGIDANGMDYGKLTPLLVEAVNALRTEKDMEIALRDQRIEALEKTNVDLESRLAQLEEFVAELAAQKGAKR